MHLFLYEIVGAVIFCICSELSHSPCLPSLIFVSRPASLALTSNVSWSQVLLLLLFLTPSLGERISKSQGLGQSINKNRLQNVKLKRLEIPFMNITKDL